MKNSTRRTFLRQSIIGAGGLAILPLASSCKAVAPSDSIRLGIIGLGQQAMNLMRGFSRVTGVEVVAGADVYGIKRERFKKFLDEYYSEQDMKVDVTTYSDYREILDRDDIDGVIIATPDHWHAIIAIAACKAGKDIYLEKPITFSIKESLAVVKAVRENNVILAVGSQQRSDINFQTAVEKVWAGAIGDLKTINAYVGPPPAPYNLPEEPIPADLDWETWLGPMPYVHYNPRLNPPISLDPVENETFWAEWRYFKETGGGFTTDWGAHNFDIGQWGAGKNGSGPVKVIPAGYEDHEFLTYVYDTGVIMTNEAWDEQSTRGIKFWGSDGWIEVQRGKYNASDASLFPEGYEASTDPMKYESASTHLENFIDCMKSREEPMANVETGQRTVVTCILGNIAHELGRPVEWDPAAQFFVNDPDAEKFFHREYREGYTL